jgi:hypothetical protein
MSLRRREHHTPDLSVMPGEGLPEHKPKCLITAFFTIPDFKRDQIIGCNPEKNEQDADGPIKNTALSPAKKQGCFS